MVPPVSPVDIPAIMGGSAVVMPLSQLIFTDEPSRQPFRMST